MKHFAICLFFILCEETFSQTSGNFNFVCGFGPGYFLNDKSLKRRIDNTTFAGVNFEFGNKKRGLRACPGIQVQINDYHAGLRDGSRVHVSQHTFSAHLDMLMKLNKSSLIRVGLIFGRVFQSEVEISWEQANGTLYTSSTDLYTGYSYANNQAGLSLGFCLPFKMFRRQHKFTVTYQYIASRLVNSDYYLSRAVVGEDLKVLSLKARPSMLLFGFEINCNRAKKKKEIQEES